MNRQAAQGVKCAEAYLGLELGSTRIKAILIDKAHNPLASGSFAWENKLENGVWTYNLADAWRGVQACFAELARSYRETELVTIGE